MAETESQGNQSLANHDSPYIKDLQKSTRNVNKKLSLTAKVDSIIAENPEMTLDQLVSSRKINNDQKAQALKKPLLEVQRAQLEEQIATYKKIEAEFHDRAGKEQEELKAAHEKALEELRSQIKPQEELANTAPQEESLRKSLLSLSRFLRAAAARRMTDEDEDDETKAFEGALLLFYGGDETAVDAMEKLINGAEEGVLSTDGSMLDVTYGTIKKMSLELSGVTSETPQAEDVAEVQPEIQHSELPNGHTDAAQDGSDPTITYAGLTEQTDAEQPLTNGHSAEDAEHNIEVGNIDAGAANTSAATQWDTQAPASDPISESWVQVPREVSETENVQSTASVNTTQNWADETPPAPAPVEAVTASVPDDGFKEVRSNRGGRGRGEGGRGGQEGRGGRGRGGFRGGRGRGGNGGNGGRGRGGREGGGPAPA